MNIQKRLSDNFIHAIIGFFVILLFVGSAAYVQNQTKNNSQTGSSNSANKQLQLQKYIPDLMDVPSWKITVNYNTAKNSFLLKKISFVAKGPLMNGPENIFSSYRIVLLNNSKKILRKQRMRINDGIITDTFNQQASALSSPSQLETTFFVPYSQDISTIEIKNGLKTILDIHNLPEPNFSMNLHDMFVTKADAQQLPAPFCHDKPLRILILPYGYADDIEAFKKDASILIGAFKDFYPELISSDNFRIPDKMIDYENTLPPVTDDPLFQGKVPCAEYTQWCVLRAAGMASQNNQPIQAADHLYAKDGSIIQIDGKDAVPSDFTHIVFLASDVVQGLSGANLGGPNIVVFRTTKIGFTVTAVHEILGHGVAWLFDRYVQDFPEDQNRDYYNKIVSNKDNILWSNCSLHSTGEPWWSNIYENRKVCAYNTYERGCGNVPYLYAPTDNDCVSDSGEKKPEYGPIGNIMSACSLVHSSNTPPTFDPRSDDYWIKNYVIPTYNNYQTACKNYTHDLTGNESSLSIQDKALCDAGDCDACSLDACGKINGCMVYQDASKPQEGQQCVAKTDVDAIQKNITPTPSPQPQTSLNTESPQCPSTVQYNIGNFSDLGQTKDAHSIQGIVVLQKNPTEDLGINSPGFGCMPIFLLQDGKVILTAKSSNNPNQLGHFNFNNLPQGSYTVKLGSLEGYAIVGSELFPDKKKFEDAATMQVNEQTDGDLVILGLTKNIPQQ